MSKNNSSKLILGTAQFGLAYGINNQLGKPSQLSVNEILNTAFNSGVSLLDTAEAYGNSQDVIGNYHLLGRGSFDIITKYGPSNSMLPKGLSDRVNANLDLLSVERLYAYMYHSYGQFKEFFEGHRREIKLLKQRGIIKKFGVSVYLNEEIEALLKEPEIDLIQIPFNLLDNESQRGKFLIQAKDKGLEIHTRSTFLQGLFFKKPRALQAKLKPLAKYIDHLYGLTSKTDVEMGALALAYVLQNPSIDNVLIGVDTPDQLLTNLSVAKQKIPMSVISEVNEISVREIELLNPSNW